MTVQHCMMKKAQTKKPAARNRPIEVPSLNNPNHVFDIYGETVVMLNTLKIP